MINLRLWPKPTVLWLQKLQMNLLCYFLWLVCCYMYMIVIFWYMYWVAPKKRNSQFFRTVLWSTVIFFTLLDRASFPHYNNTKIIKFGWELFILWVISLIWTVIFGICPISRVPRHDWWQLRPSINWPSIVFSDPYIAHVDLHTTLPNKDLQSRHVINW